MNEKEEKIHKDLRRQASKRINRKPKAHVRGFDFYEKQRATVYSLLKLYHSFKQDQNMDKRNERSSEKSGYTLDDSPKLWWLYWKDMHEKVFKGRLERMQRCFLDRFPMEKEEGEEEELLRDTEKFNKYLNRVIEGTSEKDFADSLLSTSRDKRDDQGNSMIRDLILQNMCLHFEAAEADHECLEIAEDWFEWEKSVWNSSSSNDEDLPKKLSHVALLEKMISKSEEEKLFAHSSSSSTSKSTKKTSNNTTTSTKKSHSSLNILCRDLLKELMKVHTKGDVDPKLWKEYGGGEPWTESLRDFSLKQHLETFRVMHESRSSRSRERLLERCGSSDKTRGSLLTHQSIEEINRLWSRAKILANKTYASKASSFSFSMEGTHKLAEIVQKDITRAQYLRDVHHEHSTVSKIAEMYLSYATMTLDGVNKMSELRRAEKKLLEEMRQNHDDEDERIDKKKKDYDDDLDENEVFDVDAMSKTYRFSEETIRKYKEKVYDADEDDEDDGHLMRRRETMRYIPHGRRYDEL
eukprot:g646.t1